MQMTTSKYTPPVAEIDLLSDQQAIVRAMLDPNLDFIAEVRFSEMTDLPTLPRFIAPKRVQILACTAAGRWQVYEPDQATFVIVPLMLACKWRSQWRVGASRTRSLL